MPPKNKIKPGTYERIKAKARERNAQAALEGREIGKIPAVANPKRRKKCEADPKLWLKTYFPKTFYFSWSDDQIILIEHLERVLIFGGLQAVAMPRGGGKTQISIRMALRALMMGKRKFLSLIGSVESSASDLIEAIKIELETNETLAEDYPEVCYPIRALGGIVNRCKGQLCQGERTRIIWEKDRISLPMIKGSKAAGGKCTVAGITGAIRGLSFTQPGGGTIRPEVVIIDDPQDDESAKSPEQVKYRLKIIKKTILGLAAPGVKISVIIPCTVIERDDVADQLLNREKSPQWNGIRTKLMLEFPKNMDLWREYCRIRTDSFAKYNDIRDATTFYKNHRTEMDEGAKVSWPERFDKDQISGIQFAMDKFLDDEASFFSEFQNEPMSDETADESQLTQDDIVCKLNSLPQFIVPVEATNLTCYIDVMQKALFYSVVAWDAGTFAGSVIDYGTFPEQKRREFTLADMRTTLKTRFPNQSPEAQIYEGLQELVNSLADAEYRRGDGSVMHIEKIGIDANWGEMTNLVYQFCRQSKYSAILLPCHGKGITADMRPFMEYRKAPGDRIGHNWMMPNIRGKKRMIKYLNIDTNYWKTFIRSRLKSSMGESGAMSLWGKDKGRHMLFAEHCCSEFATPTEGRGRKVNVWKMKPNHHDNHWFDCVVGSAVIANLIGVEFPGVTDADTNRKITRDKAMRPYRKPERSLDFVHESDDLEPGRGHKMSWADIQRQKRNCIT